MNQVTYLVIIGFFFAFGNPISELKVNQIPSSEDAIKLNYSKEDYEVFMNSKNEVEYREYDYHGIQGNELPFKITPSRSNKLFFGGRQVNLKVENGWLVGFDKGEWGGTLYWFNEDGTHYEKILVGNIKNLFDVKGNIYVIEGLAHLSMSNGQIIELVLNENQWTIGKKVDLPHAPDATTIITNDNKFLIVTSHGLLKVDKNFNIEPLIENGFWSGVLYPNSILINERHIYIGMRGGILRIRFDDMHKQEWLTKK